MADALKTVRVIAGTNNATYKQVNIITSLAGCVTGEVPQYIQAAGVATLNNYPTVQKSAATNAAFKTIYIPGFTAAA